MEGQEEWEIGPHAALTRDIIGAAIEVQRALGPGLLESAYEACLAHELVLRGHTVQRQVPLDVTFKGLRVANAMRMDLLVDDIVVVELKVADAFIPEFEAQILSYLRFSNRPVGLVINFKLMPLAKRGVRRFLFSSSSSSSSSSVSSA